MNIQKERTKSIVGKAHELLIKKGICARDGSGDPIIEGAISYLLLFAEGQLVLANTDSKEIYKAKEKRQFIVLDKVQLDDPTYIAFCGSTYSEENLREWANDRWGTSKDAELDVIARDIKQGGWMLFEFIATADPDPTREGEPKIGLTDLIRRT